MRNLIVFIAVLAAILAAAFLFRVQPSGTATVFRSGSRVIVRTTPLYVRAIGATSCHAPMIGDRLVFEGDVPNDQFTTHIRFTYTTPPSVPANWPDGDWCTSLATRIRVPAMPLLDLLDHRRESGDRIAAAIEQDLRAAGILATVSARVDLPPGFERLRAVAEVVRREEKKRPVIFLGPDGAGWQLTDWYIVTCSRFFTLIPLLLLCIRRRSSRGLSSAFTMRRRPSTSRGYANSCRR